MKRRMKISGLIGAMILAMGLSGCGQKKEEQSTTQELVTEESAATGDTEATTETTTETTTEEAKVEITVPEDGSIRVKGEVYTFSAENGIDNWGEIAGGYVMFGGAANTLYPIDGGEPVKVDYKDHVNYPVVFQRSVNREVSGVTIGKGGFTIYSDYVLPDGVTSTVTGDELIAKGYMQRRDSDEYFMYATENGYVSFSDIEADYEKIVTENSFKSLEYYDVLGEVSADRIKSYYNMDDVAGAVEMFSNDGDAKMSMLNWLAQAKCTKQLITGEIDYYITQSIIVDPTDGAEVSLVFSVKDEYINNWMTNWGVTQ